MVSGLRTHFVHDDRLGIDLPKLERPWELIAPELQAAIIAHWEVVRGQIPDRIFRLEASIRAKQGELDAEEDFRTACRLNGEIAELASRINDLQIWYRIQQDMEETKRHS
ncbi:hypothetical protein [Cohnella sp. REN36]|uniref:hypothetical protein n=1 Tax=Cohnella sp. REN36 TaxID=2887347 RepID=UPI001D15D9DF|nr:hypothetical protein [Cohnella sp. REN36]MCC3376381.1 hypothetical protein [Cohnella sp. REN36]